MSVLFKEGERVKLVDRASTNSDIKSGLYYRFYADLTGTIFKIYGKGETAQAAIEVDLDTLPAEIQKRHEEQRSKMVNTLSGEAKRQSQIGGDNEFLLRYVILVSLSDVLRLPKPKAVKEKPLALATAA